MDHNFERHVLQTMYTDVLVGELFDKLHEKGIYDKAAIVLTADHGEAFLTGEPRRRISARNISDIAVVPFFVKLPGQRAGEVDNRPVLTVDALPTLAKAAGVDVPWKTDGMPVDERPASSDEQITAVRRRRPGRRYRRRRSATGYRDRQAYERRILRAGRMASGRARICWASSVEATGRSRATPVPRSTGGRLRRRRPDAARSRRSSPVTSPASPKRPRSRSPSTAASRRPPACSTSVARDQYVAMVPPETLRAGKNTVTVLQILADGRLKVIGWARPTEATR